MNTLVPTSIRWGVNRDLPEIVEIEQASFKGNVWNEEDFRNCLKVSNRICKVVECDNKIVAYIIYQLEKDSLLLINFAVHPHYRRMRVGGSLIQELINKLNSPKRHYIIGEIRETNLAAQIFFRSLGFRATEVTKNCYEDTGEDAYKFVYETQTNENDSNEFMYNLKRESARQKAVSRRHQEKLDREVLNVECKKFWKGNKD